MTINLSIPTGRPKAEILDLAFDDCGMAGYGFERTAEEQTMALKKLNALMLEEPWSLLGYRQPTYGAGQAEDQSGLPDFAINTVASYLALRIAPGMGQNLSQEQRAAMSRSLLNMQAQISTIPEALIPGNTVLGSGQRTYGYSVRYPYTGAQ